MAVTTSPPLPATRALCRQEPHDATGEALTLGQVPGRLVSSMCASAPSCMSACEWATRCG